MKRRDFLKVGIGIAAVPSVTVARVSPRDVIVLTSDHYMPMGEREAYMAALKRVFPRNAGLILQGGVKLEVKREE